MKKIIYTLYLCSLFFTSHGQSINMDKLKGMTARSIGPAGMSGRVTAIDVIEKNPDIMYIGTASGGVWKTDNAGTTWTPLFDNETVLSIGAIAIQQDNPSVIWVGTGEGNPRNSLNSGYGLYKSIDGGITWERIGLENTRNIHRIIIDPTNPNTVYVGAIGFPWGEHPERGVFKTTNGGKTWKPSLVVNEKTGCADLVMDPTNPNKLIAAMWEHRRKPWTFHSGGPGSGLYMTFDGGENWKKQTSKEGLPKGTLGRMGIAIAASDPQVVYALIESKKNALYKSINGGQKWKMMNNDMNDIGNRPFYYSDIRVDPKNKNHIYAIYSEVNHSIDGGKTFQKLLDYGSSRNNRPTPGVHPDHHAWYIHPDDPSFIVDGNDGGLNISRDGGKTWHFVENLPLGQFYHISVDQDHPYRVYGGLQDDGSWVGPAYVWKQGGIRNTYWQAVMFGDGFDVVPDPDDNRYGYAMSQGGRLGRYDRLTGETRFIAPWIDNKEGIKLRFNWNAAIAQDPHNTHTIYYGSQFVHKSTDKGSSWEIISPDLTTNDLQKQLQNQSGGLTIDATGAENHCTILSIAPSPIDKSLIWVGTDDGQVQLTQNAGKTWKNITKQIKDLPVGAWISQITASKYHPGEVWIVANHYRMSDFSPYLFHSSDYGRTWKSVVTAEQLAPNAYTLSFAQDKVEPNLLFLGTDNGLFVSLDKGKTFTQWTNGYPKGVSTADLVIHPREYDLVIGTFGRAIYILDDIRPLQELARQGTSLLDKKAHLFSPPDAYQVSQQRPAGILFPGGAVFSGTNKPDGALISYIINKPQENQVTKDQGSDEEKASQDSVKNIYDSLKIEIVNDQKEIVRTLTIKAPDQSGLHRTTWDLREQGVFAPSRKKIQAKTSTRPKGIAALPGTYTLRLQYGDDQDSTSITVKADPRYDIPDEVIKSRYQKRKQLQRQRAQLSRAMQQLLTAKQEVEDFQKALQKENQSRTFKRELTRTKAVIDSITLLMDYIVGKENKKQGIIRNPKQTPKRVNQIALYYFISYSGVISKTEENIFARSVENTKQVQHKMNRFLQNTWADYCNRMGRINIPRFSTFSTREK